MSVGSTPAAGALLWMGKSSRRVDFGISIPTIKSSTRNLLFELGGPMERVLPSLIDRSWAPLDLDTIQTILGYQRRPRYRTRKRRSTEWEVTVEKPTYDLTIFQLLVAS